MKDITNSQVSQLSQLSDKLSVFGKFRASFKNCVKKKINTYYEIAEHYILEMMNI